MTHVVGSKNVYCATKPLYDNFYFPKNLGRLWLAYTDLQGDFYMLQLIPVDTRYFTHKELHRHFKRSRKSEICHHVSLVIGKDHKQMLIESAQHSFKTNCLVIKALCFFIFLYFIAYINQIFSNV